MNCFCFYFLECEFKCRNDVCISRELLCNGNDDCGDNSDESEHMANCCKLKLFMILSRKSFKMARIHFFCCYYLFLKAILFMIPFSAVIQFHSYFKRNDKSFSQIIIEILTSNIYHSVYLKFTYKLQTNMVKGTIADQSIYLNSLSKVMMIQANKVPYKMV